MIVETKAINLTQMDLLLVTRKDALREIYICVDGPHVNTNLFWHNSDEKLKAFVRDYISMLKNPHTSIGVTDPRKGCEISIRHNENDETFYREIIRDDGYNEHGISFSKEDISEGRWFEFVLSVELMAAKLGLVLEQ